MSQYEMEYIDYVDRGVELLQKRDVNAWELGDLVVDFEVTVGRPVDPEAPTLADLAISWDVSSQRMSEWRNTSKFFPTDVRTFGLTWSHYNMARRASGGELDNALELLDAAKRLHLGVRAFERYIKGIYYEGAWQGELPEWLQGLIPHGVNPWVTFKKAEE